MTLQIFRSIGITVAVSACIGYFLINFNIGFWSSFALFTLIQIGIWNVFQYYRDKRLSYLQSEQEKALLDSIAKQSVALPCQSCDGRTVVPIRLDIDNGFDCDHCGERNVVYVNIETAVTTNPVGLENTIRVNEK